MFPCSPLTVCLVSLHFVLRQIFSDPWDILVVWTCTGLVSQPRVSRGTWIHRLFTACRASGDPPQELVTYTLCQCHVHLYQIQQLLEGIRPAYIFKQLKGANANVDFWMFRVHESSLVPLWSTCTTKHLAQSLHQASTWTHGNTSGLFKLRTIFTMAGHGGQQFIYIIYKILLSWQDSCLWSEDVLTAKPISLRAFTAAIFSQHAERRNILLFIKGPRQESSWGSARATGQAPFSLLQLYWT